MRCSKARRWISDFLDGTLPAKHSAQLKKHLEVCLKCRAVHHDFEGIVKGAEELKTPLPSDRAWLAIMARLKDARRKELSLEPKKSRWQEVFFPPARLRFALAALIICVIAGGILLGIKPWRAKAISGLSEQEQFTLAKLKEAEHHYQLAIEALTEALTSQRGSLDPQLAEVYASNLKVIDSAIQACQDAVRREPRNLEARVYLLSAYKEKVDFLGNAVEVKKTSPAKNGTEKTI